MRVYSITVCHKLLTPEHLLTPTVFDLCDISHHYVCHRQLYDLAPADHLEFLLLLDAALQPTELLLLRPVVEGRHQHHTHHRQQDSCALDPAGIRLALILYPTCRCATGYSPVMVTGRRRGKLYRCHTLQTSLCFHIGCKYSVDTHLLYTLGISSQFSYTSICLYMCIL